ncbi:flagellar hook-associated protein FlgK [Burkholderia oklahomensis]|uniref:Flagellar hook-associated protein 1 n=1 Tax=Burkholderia oklahomensis TaxID=342113 RepID=A0AAI8BD18_9BURK|nr:flagellar hook-associated protein FlgK [Burkholderia oklahomensis]AIO69880.1 flagellar hook-associated protein FlgK [Burkholderia oklahomensis]AOI38256.1 flagellar biosynthesis protein FlgK [Burkholderia oklahomensis EO147]KUY48619.1 flagellar biosynthesis protein FlgK [Burkholderia oklahomensis EO147]QPS41407.1 flagellar hook-associated protein FlgK [Burkholderia oklahomensis]
MNLIYIGMSGLRAANWSLRATADNTSNLATSGYSRRGVLLSSGANGGVDTSATLRFNESYKTQQLWTTNGKLGRHKASQSYLDQLERLTSISLPEGKSKTNDLGMGAFFASLNAASTDPGSSVLRQAVLDATGSMTKQFNNMRSTLNEQLRNIEQARVTTVEEINGRAAAIAELNAKIMSGQAAGADVSGLLDQRDVAVDALSGLAGVRVVQQPNGTVDVSLGTGQPLVLGNQAATMAVEHDASGRQTLSLTFGDQTMPVRTASVGGALRGLSDVEDDVLRPQMEALRSLGSQLADLVNTQLGKGYDMNGQPGKPLITYDPSTGMLGIDKTLKPDDLAFSGDPDNPGDNANLRALIELGHSKIDVPGLGTVSLENATAVMMAKIGSASRENKQLLETADATRAQAERDWQSVSGVDKDEEAMNILRFKEMYSANMKVISVANELFETTLKSI